MSTPSHQALPDEIRLVAARWAIRRDRGLSSTESIDYELWLAADPRHAVAMQRSSSAWSLLDRIPENVAAPVLATATRRRFFWRRSFVIGSLAAAAALAAMRFARPSALAPSPVANAQAVAASAGPRQLMLSDGTVVQLNTGGKVIEQFTSVERRVLLARGEAHFAVTKNPARPFVVRARNLEVRAVGTAFNVNLQSAVVDVLVTEGVVELQQAVGPGLVFESSRGERDTQNGRPTSGRPTTLIANQLAVVSLAPTSHSATTSAASPAPATVVVVTTATAEEIARTLAWQAPLLRLGGATLAELVLEFQRRSGQRVILADPALASLRVGGRFRADDLDGFTHLLATTLDLEVDHGADGTLVLRKKSSPSR